MSQPEPLGESPGRSDRRIAYIPALDGLRGVSVIGVVLFHSGNSIFKGGFLGVSLFFTLSGFLITSLLLAEFDSTGSVHLVGFWRRRFRRLLPAAWMTLMVVFITATVLGEYTQRLRSDLLAALTNTANWWQLWSGDSYSKTLHPTVACRSLLESGHRGAVVRLCAGRCADVPETGKGPTGAAGHDAASH